jgi:hypothetical protein
MQRLSSSTALTPYQAPALKLVQSMKALVIIDPAVKDFSIVVRSLDAAELLVLDADQDGIGQISAKLQSYSALETLHIVAPTCPGMVKLGKTCLDAAELEAYQAEIQAWRQAFSPHASILLHGQNVVMGTEGMALVGRLSQLTGAVIAPSSLPIGESLNIADPDFGLLAG